LEYVLPWVKNGKYQDVQHNPTCVSGSKTGRTQSNTPLDHFWGSACTCEFACERAVSEGMSERTPLVRSLSLITDSSPDNTISAGGAAAAGGGGGGGGAAMGLSQLTV